MILAMQVPTAPPASDDGSVLLWAIGVVVAALVVVVTALWKMMIRNQAECRDENTRAWKKCDEQQAEIKQLYAGALTETQALARTAIDEARKNREVLTETNKVIAGIESGKYRARDQ